MRVTARIESTSDSIVYAVSLNDDEIDVDLETWLTLAVRHCHNLRARALLADQDQVTLEEMDTAGE